MNRFLTLALALLALAVTSCVTDDDPVNSGVAAGDSLPAFSVTLSDGSVIDNASLRGRHAVIEFFNTDCQDCRESLPVLQQFYDRVRNNPDIVVVAIAREESLELIRTYWTDNNLSIPFSPQPDRKIYNLFATVGIPRIYIVNTEGTVTANFGPENPPSLSQLISLTSSI